MQAVSIPRPSRKGPFRQLYSGNAFYPLDPHPEDFTLEDVAHGLAYTCRFGGACRPWYSNAQHAVNVSYLVDAGDEMWGLHHDDEEALIGFDAPGPYKLDPILGPFFKDLERPVARVVATKFNLPYVMPPSVKRADMQMLINEKEQLMIDGGWQWGHLPPKERHVLIVPWSPEEAEVRYLQRHNELIAKARAAA